MTQNPSDQKMCNICHQRFNSEAELQEHQNTAHAQRMQGGNQPASERNYNEQPGQNQRKDKEEKIA